MECATFGECLEEIREYISGDSIGFPLLVNTENFEDFYSLHENFESNKAIKKIYISEMMQENGLPNVSDIYGKAFEKGVHIVIGVSQSLMLQGEEVLIDELRQIAGTSTRGKTIILLSHCETYLRKLIEDNERLLKWTLFWKGKVSNLPTIIVSNVGEFDKRQYEKSVKGLVYALEHFSGIPEDKQFLVATKFSVAMFKNSLYPIKQEASIYERLKKNFPELGENSLTEKSGTDADWEWLSNEIQKAGAFRDVIKKYFGDTNVLSWQLEKEIKEKDERRRWLYWLSLNVYPPKGEYFRFAISRSKSLSELENELYMSLLDINLEDENFEAMYSERREILDKIEINQTLILRYCQNVGKKDKAAVFYLTDKTEIEQTNLLKCLSAYEYSDEELKNILKQVAPELEIYLRAYNITTSNVGAASIEDDVLFAVSKYFMEYKKQKLTNKIKSKFLSEVEEYANKRPYNKFLTRSSILNKLSVKNAEAFFFDALGVEYLSYIAAKCEEIGLMTDIKIGRGELPSITSKNKDFYDFFAFDSVHKIEELDECKHHSKKFDYQTCPYPIHIFDELQIINREIKNIYVKMMSERIEKVVIVSDHGASRLAVINKSENDAIVLDEKGEHSGRCAVTEKDPKIPFATFENGYAVLANYDRFKGGRKANVEVHGGATLEEVLVLVIVLTLRPEKLEYSFVKSELLFKPGQDATLILFCNAPMKKPRLKVNDKFYEGVFTVDKQHAEFYLEGVRRKGKYEAGIYDDNVFQGITLSFEIKKQTLEDDLGI